LLPCTNVFEDFCDDVGIFDAGNHSELAATVRASFYIDGEHTFEALHSGVRCEGFIRFLFTGFTFWHDRLTLLAMRGKHAGAAGEVQTRSWHQCGEASDLLEGIEHDVGGAVAKRLRELVDHLSSFVVSALSCRSWDRWRYGSEWMRRSTDRVFRRARSRGNRAWGRGRGARVITRLDHGLLTSTGKFR